MSHFPIGNEPLPNFFYKKTSDKGTPRCIFPTENRSVLVSNCRRTAVDFAGTIFPPPPAKSPDFAQIPYLTRHFCSNPYLTRHISYVRRLLKSLPYAAPPGPPKWRDVHQILTLLGLFSFTRHISFVNQTSKCARKSNIETCQKRRCDF